MLKKEKKTFIMLSCLESFCAAEVPQRHGSSLEIYMALFLPTCMDRMYSEFFSSTIFHREKVTSDFFAEEVVEDLAGLCMILF